MRPGARETQGTTGASTAADSSLPLRATHPTIPSGRPAPALSGCTRAAPGVRTVFATRC